MGELGDSAGRGVTREADAVTLTGRGRLPSDVASQLMDLLADEPRVVRCDLTGMAAAGPAIADMLDPAIAYLADWPTTVLVVTAPDPDVRARLASPDVHADWFLVRDDGDIGPSDLPRLPALQREVLQLPPEPTAPRAARGFVARTLRDWELGDMGPAASLVVSELVTNSILHAVTVMDVQLSRAERRVRIGVRDRGGGRPSARPGESTQHTLDGRGLQLVQAYARNWGVIPAQSRGKTVWAVLDAAEEMAESG